jgi:hypothetical protein
VSSVIVLSSMASPPIRECPVGVTKKMAEHSAN